MHLLISISYFFFEAMSFGLRVDLEYIHHQGQGCCVEFVRDMDGQPAPNSATAIHTRYLHFTAEAIFIRVISLVRMNPFLGV